MYFFSWWPNYDNPLNYAQPLFTKSGWGYAGGNAGLYYNSEADGLIMSMANAVIDYALVAKSKRVQQIVPWRTRPGSRWPRNSSTSPTATTSADYGQPVYELNRSTSTPVPGPAAVSPAAAASR